MGGRQWVAFNIHIENASITQYTQAHYVSSHYRPCFSMQSGRVLTLQKENKNVRQPGIEPGSIAWKATMLTFTPPTLHTDILFATIKIFEKFVNSPKDL